MSNHQNNLLNTLSEKGMPIFEDGMEVGITLTCSPAYRNNAGFHHIKGDEFEAILLKGVYKDFLRLINGYIDFDSNTWHGIAHILNNSEMNMNAKLAITLNIADVITITKAELCEKEYIIRDDNRDYFIPRPLTNVEYQLPASNLYDSDVILSSGLFALYLPQNLTPFSLSIYEKLPDLLNPIFISCNLKTLSPTILPVFNRLFVNLNSIEKSLNTIGLGDSMFRLNFAHQLYLKGKYKESLLKKSLFPVQNIEIIELLEEFERTLQNITHSDIVEEKFFEKYAQLSIVDEYVLIKLSDKFSKLLKFIPDVSEALQAIYLTRENSIFKGDVESSSYFDVNYATRNSEFRTEYKKLTINEVIKELSFFTRLRHSGTVKKLIKGIGELLDMRDKSFILKNAFNKQVRKELLKLAEYALNKGRIKNKDDIFLFSHEEVRRIAFDSYYGEVDNTITFRKWQLSRYSAQVMPTEIFARDIEKSAEISEKMMTKALEQKEFKCISFFHNEDLTLATDDEILVKCSLPFNEFEAAVKHKALLLENFSIFSHLAEFACLHQIPVYTGVRFARLIFSGEKLYLKKETILRSKDD